MGRNKGVGVAVSPPPSLPSGSGGVQQHSKLVACIAYCQRPLSCSRRRSSSGDRGGRDHASRWCGDRGGLLRAGGRSGVGRVGPLGDAVVEQAEVDGLGQIVVHSGRQAL